jgi:hypothetical protein
LFGIDPLPPLVDLAGGVSEIKLLHLGEQFLLPGREEVGVGVPGDYQLPSLVGREAILGPGGHGLRHLRQRLCLGEETLGPGWRHPAFLGEEGGAGEMAFRLPGLALTKDCQPSGPLAFQLG